MKKRQIGFSLVELVVVVAIIAILIGIGLPNYRDYMTKAARTDAKAALMNLVQIEERYYSNQVPPIYFDTNSALKPTWQNWAGGSDIGSRKYDISITLANAGQTYTLKATPANGFSDARCGELSITSAGVKAPTTATCW